MQFGDDPNMTEETRLWIESTKPMVEGIMHNRKTNPAGYFKGDRNSGDGVEIFEAGTEPPETVYDRLRRTGRIPY